MTGKKNKYEARRATKKAKLPLRTIQLSEQFLRLCTEFFETCDFVHMLFILVSTMSIAVNVVSLMQ